ncbi:hypothetical protein A9R01_00475 ['Osedax' symbiont bacterium Rs2_46_30_T18]|nr:hypothetical protein A9R01_00475 ['Osedax' symbiont bacterium Rs2_46_30_T18]
MKLLVAEDDKTTQLILASVCTKWGYEVVCVNDGLAAWQVMQGNDAPQLMVIDWEMPHMSGIDLCQHIREEYTDNPPYIILLTSRNETQDVVHGLKKGANDYIVKPFNIDELQVRISVGKRVLRLQNQLHATHNVLSIERAIIEDIILGMNAGAAFENNFLRSIQAAVEKTSGDILLASSCPDGRQHVLLGDFTGHGLTAALGGPIASEIFYKMTSKGLTMDEIGNEINRYMCNKMPTGLFLAAILFEVNPQRDSVRIWNCGMEDVLCFRNASLVKCIQSTRPALGIIKAELNNVVMLAFETKDKLYAYSDGIIETASPDNEMFGRERLITSISEMLKNNRDIQEIHDDVHAFRATQLKTDDLTIVEISL